MRSLGDSGSRTQGGGRERTTCARPLPPPPLPPPSSAAPGAACVLVPCGPGTSFVKRQLEETPALAMADEKPKEGVKTENNDHINLKVAGQDGSVVQFKIKRHTPLSKLMKAYCERQILDQYWLTECLQMLEIQTSISRGFVNEADQIPI
ncbi:small ubiquitin-related modifier 2 isoform X4 [Bubalus kerabau]|uniref:small ubiquitin-related modifier 2 isoform X4 n=1 Tax=Bubalus carabanensis TaxID=3119969 RepID=UPI00244EF383|nr:small ubiquitin-related modifier 2 isoform X4 [Bubalus carabanensis]